MTKRKFGVEIECGFNQSEGGAYPMREACEDVKDILFKNGFKTWARQHIHPDGSGVEIPSPVLVGADGLKELKEVMHCLSGNKVYVTNRDGMHVHHDATEFLKDHPASVRLVKSWVANDSCIKPMVDKRRRGLGHCPDWTPGQVELIETLVWVGAYQVWDDRRRQYVLKERETKYKWPSSIGPRGSLNLTNLNNKRKGTIEIRLHEGTLDGDQAAAWVQFGQAFVESALKRKHPIPASESTEQLLTRIRVAKEAQETLMKRVNG